MRKHTAVAHRMAASTQQRLCAKTSAGPICCMMTAATGATALAPPTAATFGAGPPAETTAYISPQNNPSNAVSPGSEYPLHERACCLGSSWGLDARCGHICVALNTKHMLSHVQNSAEQIQDVAGSMSSHTAFAHLCECRHTRASLTVSWLMRRSSSLSSSSGRASDTLSCRLSVFLLIACFTLHQGSTHHADCASLPTK